MIVQDISVSGIKPYDKNAKKHTERQIAHISKSIEEFAFTQPLVIDENGIIIIGHARFEAAKASGFEKVPCVVVTDWSEEKKKACRLADNQMNTETGNSQRLLKGELKSLFRDIDMGKFGFDLDNIFKAPPPAGYKQTRNFGNFFKMPLDIGTNEWGIPETKPFRGNLKGIEWVSFGEKARVKDFSNVGIHFYIDDYKFETVWNLPDKWMDMFLKCKTVVTPDFSNYTDMPKAHQLWNHYRRQWCGRYWQDRGVNVVSSLSWANGQLFDFSFMGIPKGTTVATSFVGDSIDKEQSIDELRTAIEVVAPHAVYIKCNSVDERALRESGIQFSRMPNYEWK